jgi:hypothetical protein
MFGSGRFDKTLPAGAGPSISDLADKTTRLA